MAGPTHWGTRPDLIIAEMKQMAREAAKRGSPEGLTALGKAYYYEVFTDANRNPIDSSQCPQDWAESSNSRHIQLGRAAGDVQLHRSNEQPWHRPFCYGNKANPRLG